MELGQKLKQARLEAGMSQRQLCGDVVTRNMLSLIENGSAQPSMDTLRFFAQQLGKPVSYFLEEGNVLPTDAQKAWQLLELAEKALEEKRIPYAKALLEEAKEPCGSASFCRDELERRRLLLLYRAEPQQAVEIAGQLGDEELLLRADAALARGDGARCAALLDSANLQNCDRWLELRAECHFALGEFHQAAECYLKTENQSLRRLEQCYEKLGDYKMAYHYACLQRERNGEK
jgi:transcriptional regulator with XRE-family HTH domain